MDITLPPFFKEMKSNAQKYRKIHVFSTYEKTSVSLDQNEEIKCSFTTEKAPNILKFHIVGFQDI